MLYRLIDRLRGFARPTSPVVVDVTDGPRSSFVSWPVGRCVFCGCSQFRRTLLVRAGCPDVCRDTFACVADSRAALAGGAGLWA